MRMSCNGCRVLRKGCSDSCAIRPCLLWIKTAEAQANATVFLAKFYGRAGLINLISAGPDHLRPAIFRSLLYEACGRIVNPIYGAVGMLWSGNWQLCQEAVENVLKGAPITQISSDLAAAAGCPGQKAYDIRHITKSPDAADVHRVATKSRIRFKRSAAAAGCKPSSKDELRSPTARGHESDRESRENNGSMYSAEAMERSHVSQGDARAATEAEIKGEVDEDLDLTLRLEPASAAGAAGWCGAGARPMGEELSVVKGWRSDACHVEQGLCSTA